MTTDDSTRAPWSGARRATQAALLAGYAALALAVYWPCLAGGPVSDDTLLIMNPWVTNASPSTLRELVDPRSQATLYLRNYAPVRPLVQALELRLFDHDARLFHVSNVFAHALACWLVALLMTRSGLPRRAAWLAGAFLLVHPALVEAIAWMSQIWNPLGLAVGTSALLAQRRRPALACALFALALLTRPTAVSFLPVAMIREWGWWRAGERARRRRLWLAAWVLALAAVGAAELQTFHGSLAAPGLDPYPDAAAKARTVVAGFGRYLAMAATGFGVSPFQEPRAALSWLDPWWLLGLAGGAAISLRILVCLARGREEAAWWVWALAAFVPISQLFPFLYPTADRYLYFILPGLVGGALLAGQEAAGHLVPARFRERAARVAAAGALLVIAGFAVWSHSRSALWASEDRVLADAARHFPHGLIAQLLSARRAASRGDVDDTVAAFERCRARGWNNYGFLLSDPAFEPVRGTPPFRALIARFADDLIEIDSRRSRMGQMDLLDLAQAYELRGRRAEAAATLERALELGGPFDPTLRAELERLRTAPSDDAAIIVPGVIPEER